MTNISDLELGERLGRIETKLDTIMAWDHEQRLRSLEEFKTRLLAISIVIGSVGAIANWALTIITKVV